MKETIDESTTTDISVDPLGAPHLTDKKTGKEVTVKADGVVASTTPRFLNGQEITCVPLNEVAGAVNGLASSTKASIVFRDAKGLESKITPLTEFEDNDYFLSFDGGKVKVILNSDDCNVASDKPADEDADGDGIRRLGLSMNSKANIFARLRQSYVSFRTDLHEGRTLSDHSNANARVVTDSLVGILFSQNICVQFFDYSPYYVFSYQLQPGVPPQASECKLQMSVALKIDPRDQGEDIGILCEMDEIDAKGKSGQVRRITGSDQQMSDLTKMFQEGNLHPNDVFMLGADVGVDSVDLVLGPGVHVNSRVTKGNPNAGRRRLSNIPSGNKPTLVIRVTDINGLVRPENAAQMSDDIFGTNGDPVNLKSQVCDIKWT